ncbi:MXAN_5187 C-terminal domain-containing protein [Geobacter sp. DSM 9736]|uniref:MXAN_5187 C-terminal domain-containing protein n=1 Tax=Geobacter sp. DSM 9736 TaxID=1277350 RepID=UPI000B5130D5|nr:MXAN_5187 C-terminal domain-containing protein [Geobacter sp. DSM 9736]SNB47657.1 hypothetical protein SAMN06269301_3149 [Geobacter sp. DSM 9736]
MGLAEDIILFEKDLNELIIRYEQYFLGIEKRAPLKLLEKVERYVRRYSGTPIVNTMLKFKFTSISARFNSYKQYWNRINTLIEEGRYSRDRFKMEMHHAPDRVVKPAAALDEKATPASETDNLYRQYIEARQACNLPVNNITPALIDTLVAQQKPEIMKKYQCDKVEYKVVIEGGTPRIKVRPLK